MATYAQLRKAVAGYMTREEKAFKLDGFDSLQQAINDAHQWAQRTHIFERASTYITVPDVSLTSGANLSTAVYRGTTDPVLIRSLKVAWLPNANGTGERPLDITSREVWVERLKRRYDQVVSNGPLDTTTTLTYSGPLEVILQGQTIHLSAANPDILINATTTDLHFDATEWLVDYVEEDDTDFFLDYCFDFMTFRSVYQLNHYLKEDQRVAVSNKLLEDTWLSVIRWDTSFIPHSTNDNYLR